MLRADHWRVVRAFALGVTIWSGWAGRGLAADTVVVCSEIDEVRE